MTYRLSLFGGAHDGGVIETEDRPPERSQRVHRAGDPSRVISTTYIDTGTVRRDGSLIYIAQEDS